MQPTYVPFASEDRQDAHTAALQRELAVGGAVFMHTLDRTQDDARHSTQTRICEAYIPSPRCQCGLYTLFWFAAGALQQSPAGTRTFSAQASPPQE